MLDVLNEDSMTLAEAGRLLPHGPGGKLVHRSTLLRWITRGVTAVDGSRVRLEAAKLGDRFVTSRQAVVRFMEALTPALDSEPAPSPRTPQQRRRAVERAGKKLEGIGI